MSLGIDLAFHNSSVKIGYIHNPMRVGSHACKKLHTHITKFPEAMHDVSHTILVHANYYNIFTRIDTYTYADYTTHCSLY